MVHDTSIEKEEFQAVHLLLSKNSKIFIQNNERLLKGHTKTGKTSHQIEIT